MRDSSQSLTTAQIYEEMFALQRDVRFERDQRPSPIAEDAGIRGRLLRAGAAWLISWASLLAVLNWVPRG